jgi:large subunit ribosomal protein L3
MAGHMGAVNVTSKNLRIVRKDEAKGLLLVAGSVPGASNGVVRVTHAKSHSRK